jgi:hypothetical protein
VRSTTAHASIVPEFFGYHTPSCDSADSYEDKYDEESESVWGDVRWFLEDISLSCCWIPAVGKSRLICYLVVIGEIFRASPPSSCLANADAAVNRDTIAGIFDRLHNAKFIQGFLQGSVYERNVLVQAGCARSAR